MEKASGVSEANSSKEDVAGPGGGLTLGGRASRASDWLLAGGGVVEGDVASTPLGGGKWVFVGEEVGEEKVGLKEVGGSMGREHGSWSC